jgi:hypothetical protein
MTCQSPCSGINYDELKHLINSFINAEIYLIYYLKLHFNQIGHSPCILIYCAPKSINLGGRTLQSVNEYQEEETSEIFACVRAPIPHYHCCLLNAQVRKYKYSVTVSLSLFQNPEAYGKDLGVMRRVFLFSVLLSLVTYLLI